MPSPGQRVGHRAKRRDGLGRLAVVHFQIEFHHGIDFHGIHAAGDRHAQGVAQEMQRVMVLQELRVLVEHLALRRIIDFLLQFRGSRFAGEGEELVDHLERFQIQAPW